MAKRHTERQDHIGGCALLFRDPAPGESNLGLDEAFLRALGEVDPLGTVTTRIYRGGLLIRQLAYRTTALRVKSREHAGSAGRILSRTETTQTADMGLYATLVGDFVDSSLKRWNTVDPRRYWDLVANSAIDATFLSSVPRSVALELDRSLKSYPRYLGSLNPDLGNPLHLHLFIEMMFKNAFIRGGQVFLEGGLPGTDDASFPGAQAFSPKGSVVVPYEDFESEAPSPNIPMGLSARGLITQMRMQQRMAPTLHERLLREETDSRFTRDASREFAWDLRQLPSAPEEVDVHARKLTDYLLNPSHQRGRSKAAFFSQVLGIEKGDWQYLHAQLVDRLQESTFENVRLDEHGIRFSARLPVRGRNGATATIESAWIVRAGERASLVTAFPTKKDAGLERLASEPAVVGQELTGDGRWEAVFELANRAGAQAMEAAVPRPLVVQGDVNMDGYCGGAYVVVTDARHHFARWLKRTGRGTKHYPTGYRISTPSQGQSAERAAAYAVAFAQVLRRNGISCRVETYLS